MSTSIRPLARALLAAMLVMPIAATAAEESTDSAGTPQVSKEAQAVLDRMGTTLRGLQSFSIDSRASRDEVVSYGYKLQHNERSTLVVERPGHLRAEVSGDLRSRSFYFADGQLVMYSPEDMAYVRSPAPGTIKELVGGLLDAGVDLPLIDVLYSAADGSLAEGARGGVVVGEVEIDGVPCDHLAFRQANADWQIWVQRGDLALPKKIVITTRHEVGDPQYQATLSWNLQPKLTASTFTFTPPKDAAEVPMAK